MKKKIFALSIVALFAIGLAFYANNTSTLNALSENNVEALTDGEDGTIPEVTSDYELMPEYSCIFVKHGINKTYKNRMFNTCESSGVGCLIHLDTQTSSEQETNSSWAERVPDWASEIFKCIVIAIINKKL